MVAQELKINANDKPIYNITKETLTNAAEMFTYLNYCPPKHLILYKHIFKTASAKDIILALNTIIKEGRESTKANAELVWSFVMKKLSLTVVQNGVQKVDFIMQDDEQNPCCAPQMELRIIQMTEIETQTLHW